MSLGVPRRWAVDDILIFALVAGTILILPPFAGFAPWHGDFVTIATSTMLTALPYLVLGAVLGGAIQAFVPGAFLPALARRMGRFGIPGIALASVTIPVCECGSVAVTRGLLAKGLPLPHAVAFLLAGPVMNPTVLLSTWTAFTDWRYPAARAAGALLVAIATALVVARTSGRWLKPGIGLDDSDVPRLNLSGAVQLGAAAKVQMEQASRLRPGAILQPGSGPRIASWKVWAGSSLDHFLDMASWYAFGCMIAAGFLVSIGQGGIDPGRWGADPVLGPVSMVVAAFALSICAEADAFVANALGKHIAFPAIIAFLVSGPMLDIKLLLMYRTIFRGRGVLMLAGCVLVGVAVVVTMLTLAGIPR